MNVAAGAAPSATWVSDLANPLRHVYRDSPNHGSAWVEQSCVQTTALNRRGPYLRALGNTPFSPGAHSASRVQYVACCA
jgi:hypothetical protein